MTGNIHRHPPQRNTRNLRNHASVTSRLSLTERDTEKTIVAQIMKGGGVCVQSRRELASKCRQGDGISVDQFDRDTRAILRVGRLHCSKRRGAGKYNDTNIWTMVTYGVGGGRINAAEKREDFNTSTTPSPRAEARSVDSPPVEPEKTTASYARLRWEHNRAENHPPAMRERFEYIGQVIEREVAERQQERQHWRDWRERTGRHRLERARERNRGAAVGHWSYYHPEIKTDAEYLAYINDPRNMSYDMKRNSADLGLEVVWNEGEKEKYEQERREWQEFNDRQRQNHPGIFGIKPTNERT